MKKYLLWVIIAIAGLGVLTALFINAGKSRGKSAGGSGGADNVSAAALVSQAQDAENKGELQDSQVSYQKLINDFPNSQEIAVWQKKADDLNIKLLFSSKITPNSMLYIIKPGDNLIKIAKQFKTTPELIMKSNNLLNDKIIPGRKIKVWTAPFNILVDKSQNILILKVQEEVFKTYIVSTGANNSSPVGTFKIVNKIVNPTWFKSGAVVPPESPDNVLGTRWMGFDLAGYGIHGTIEPEKLGQQVTQGCVRMANPEVEELYTIVPVNTEVVIID